MRNLREPDEATNAVSRVIVTRAIEVHRVLGPGLMESSYQAALVIELEEAGLECAIQSAYRVVYKGRMIGEFRPDLIVQDAVGVEVKSVERHSPVFDAQILT